MAIKRSTFGGWKLTEEDAEAFLRQVNDKNPNMGAQASYKRGQKSLEEFLQKGYAVIGSKRK